VIVTFFAAIPQRPSLEAGRRYGRVSEDTPGRVTGEAGRDGVTAIDGERLPNHFIEAGFG
jgi:hypothetical protein